MKRDDGIAEKKQVMFGNKNYEYIKKSNGEEMLIKEAVAGNQKVKVILKDKSQGNSEDIERYIVEVLSDLYIKRNVKRLI